MDIPLPLGLPPLPDAPEPASAFSVGMRGMPTGRARKAREARGTVGIAQPGDTGRPADDFYRTPPEAVDALVRLDRHRWPAVAVPGEEVWEPACGDGAICDRLAHHGVHGWATDLYAHGKHAGGLDFLAAKGLLAPVIVTNPPFKLAAEFARHGLALGATRVCLLLRLAFLEGQRRTDLWPQLDRVLVFSKRLTLWRGDEVRRDETKGGMIAFAWFCWDRRKAPWHDPTITWI